MLMPYCLGYLTTLSQLHKVKHQVQIFLWIFEWIHRCDLSRMRIWKETVIIYSLKNAFLFAWRMRKTTKSQSIQASANRVSHKKSPLQKPAQTAQLRSGYVHRSKHSPGPAKPATVKVNDSTAVDHQGNSYSKQLSHAGASGYKSSLQLFSAYDLTPFLQERCFL